MDIYTHTHDQREKVFLSFPVNVKSSNLTVMVILLHIIYTLPIHPCVYPDQEREHNFSNNFMGVLNFNV